MAPRGHQGVLGLGVIVILVMLYQFATIITTRRNIVFHLPSFHHHGAHGPMTPDELELESAIHHAASAVDAAPHHSDELAAEGGEEEYGVEDHGDADVHGQEEEGERGGGMMIHDEEDEHAGSAQGGVDSIYNQAVQKTPSAWYPDSHHARTGAGGDVLNPPGSEGEEHHEGAGGGGKDGHHEGKDKGGGSKDKGKDKGEHPNVMANRNVVVVGHEEDIPATPLKGHMHGKPGKKTACGTIHENGRASLKLGLKQWVFQTNSRTQYVHMPSVAFHKRTNSLVVAWQAASQSEGGDDQTIMYATSSNRGDTWSRPRRLPGGIRGAYGRWSPVLFQPPGGSRAPLHMFFAQSKSCFDVPSTGIGKLYRAGGDIMVATTVDCRNWTQPRYVYRQAAAGDIPKVIANQPVVVGGNRWVLPYWREKPRGPAQCKPSGEDYAGVLVSEDRGKKWVAHSKQKIRTGKLPKSQLLKPDWAIEPAIVPVRGGRLKQFFRTSRDVMYESESSDGGITWTNPSSTSLPNANSKVAATRLPNDALLIVYNHHRYKQFRRTNLYVGVSYNDGASWGEALKLEIKDAPMQYYHYPSMIHNGCDIYIVYSVYGKGIRLARLDLQYQDPKAPGGKEEELKELKVPERRSSYLQQLYGEGEQPPGGKGGGAGGGGGRRRKEKEAPDPDAPPSPPPADLAAYGRQALW